MAHLGVVARHCESRPPANFASGEVHSNPGIPRLSLDCNARQRLLADCPRNVGNFTAGHEQPFLALPDSGRSTAYFRPKQVRSSVTSGSTWRLQFGRSCLGVGVRHPGWNATHGNTGILVDLPELWIRSDDQVLRRLWGRKKCYVRCNRGRRHNDWAEALVP